MVKTIRIDKPGGSRQLVTELKRLEKNIVKKVGKEFRSAGRKTKSELNTITPRNKRKANVANYVHLADSWQSRQYNDLFEYGVVVGARKSTKKYKIIHLINNDRWVSNQHIRLISKYKGTGFFTKVAERQTKSLEAKVIQTAKNEVKKI